MTNRAKRQGTAFETALVAAFNAVPGVDARRLAEGGRNDRGDLEIATIDHPPIVVEAKCAERISVHHVVHKAAEKAQNGRRAAVVWKRLSKSTPDAKRRTEAPGGPVVAMPLHLFLQLLESNSHDEP